MNGTAINLSQDRIGIPYMNSRKKSIPFSDGKYLQLLGVSESVWSPRYNPLPGVNSPQIFLFVQHGLQWTRKRPYIHHCFIFLPRKTILQNTVLCAIFSCKTVGNGRASMEKEIPYDQFLADSESLREQRFLQGRRMSASTRRSGGLFIINEFRKSIYPFIPNHICPLSLLHFLIRFSFSLLSHSHFYRFPPSTLRDCCDSMRTGS